MAWKPRIFNFCTRTCHPMSQYLQSNQGPSSKQSICTLLTLSTCHLRPCKYLELPIRALLKLKDKAR